VDVKVVSSLSGAKTIAENLTVRASQGVNNLSLLGMNNAVLSAGSLGYLTVTGDVTGSKLMTIYDVGADGVLGSGDDGAFTTGGATGNITYLKIGGNMNSTSIAANIHPKNDLMFGGGTDGDAVAASSLGGAIGSIIITGTLTGSVVPGENFGIVSHGAIGGVWVGGSKLTLPYVLGNIIVQQSWR
jgi:hypothetical protein